MLGVISPRKLDTSRPCGMTFEKTTFASSSTSQTLPSIDTITTIAYVPHFIETRRLHNDNDLSYIRKPRPWLPRLLKKNVYTTPADTASNTFDRIRSTAPGISPSLDDLVADLLAFEESPSSPLTAPAAEHSFCSVFGDEPLYDHADTLFPSVRTDSLFAPLPEVSSPPAPIAISSPIVPAVPAISLLHTAPVANRPILPQPVPSADTVLLPGIASTPRAVAEPPSRSLLSVPLLHSAPKTHRPILPRPTAPLPSESSTDIAVGEASASGSSGNSVISVRDKGGRSKFACDYPNCGKSFTRRFNLQTHMKIHNPERERQHKCSLCSKTFYKEYDLQRHLTTHHDPSKYECVCGRKYTRTDALRRHMRATGCPSG